MAELDRPGPPTTASGGRLSYAIFSLARDHRAFAGRLLRDLGLHPGQELLLMQLLDRDGQTQSELVESVGLDHSTVSKSLLRMQKAGLLTREPAEHDKRARQVVLTAKGSAMREPIESMWTDLERATSAGLAAADIEVFIDAAAAIRRSIKQRNG